MSAAPAARTDLHDATLHDATLRVVTDLAARAAVLERDGVTRADLDALAGDGLLAVFGPPELGGVPTAQQREVAELLAGASPDAWFVWFQHGPVVKMLTASRNEALQERYLARLCSGELLGGVAYSHLRTPRPSVFATRTQDGWTLTGTQPWCTGWGLTDVVLVGALCRETDEVVFGIVPAGNRAALHSTGELSLASMSGTSTHSVAMVDLHLADDDVVLLAPRAPWAERDASGNTNVQPSTFGIALAALDLLAVREPVTSDLLRPRVLALREQAYALLDDVDPAERHEDRLALRASALLLAIECCTALLAARGGQGMDLAEPAQRLLRAAAFQLVHSQAAHIRQATLAELAA